MRSLFYSLLSLATIAHTFAANTPGAAKKTDADDDWEDKVPDTVFNGQTVPPMIELGSKDLDSSISHGNWYATPAGFSSCLY